MFFILNKKQVYFKDEAIEHWRQLCPSQQANDPMLTQQQQQRLPNRLRRKLKSKSSPGGNDVNRIPRGSASSK